jgi:hypothetical protein
MDFFYITKWQISKQVSAIDENYTVITSQKWVFAIVSISYVKLLDYNKNIT